jgi:hypothetical protein
MKPEIERVVKALRKMRGDPDNSPKGVPEPKTNEDSDPDYNQEGLTDEGIQNEVTGSGSGPEIRSVARLFRG